MTPEHHNTLQYHCYGLLPYALYSVPLLITLVGPYFMYRNSDVLSTKLHLKFSEPACFDTRYGTTFI